LTIVLFVLSLFFVAPAAQAVVPGLMNYQGTLTDDGGVALDTTVAMTFTIYYDSTGTGSIWTETQPSVVVVDGVFNVLLGSVNPLSEGLFGGTSSRWLGVQVGGDPELLPRQRIVTVAHAFHAAVAETADYAHSVPAASDGDWTISGNNIYSAVSGNVGIGTTSPTYKLTVNGYLALSSGSSAIILNDGSTYRFAMDPEGANTLRLGGGFGTIFTNSDVGIGTSSPAAKLDVAGEVNTDSLYQIDGITALSVDDEDYNVFVGHHAGMISTGHRNVFAGDSAGVASTTGSRSTFLGARAGRSMTSGLNNTFVGAEAGYLSTAGQSNTFIGAGAGRGNTGTQSTFVGNSAGQSNQGDRNTFIGNQAGMNNTTGGYNVFSGYLAGNYNTIGGFNVFLGADAGYNNTEGDGNTFVGPRAGHGNTTGMDNTYLGRWTGRYNQTGSGNVFIGNEAGYNELYSNKLYIANGPDTNDVLIYGDFVVGHVGIGTLNPLTELDVNGSVSADAYYGDGSYLTGTDDGDWTVSGSDMYSNVSGNVGIGTTTPGYPLHVYKYGNASPAYAGYFRAIGYETGGTAYGLYSDVDSYEENAYGIYATAYSWAGTAYAAYFDTGDVIVSQGNLGIGTDSPGSELEVVGDVHVTGDITREYTVGTSDLATPIAYAFINSGGSVASGTPNVSATWSATYSRYEITISAESYYFNDYVTQVTVLSSSSPYVATTSSSGGKLLVYIFDSGGTKVQQNFQFITYKP
jgi:hypothetical protein